jgi:hypothetical protein
MLLQPWKPPLLRGGEASAPQRGRPWLELELELEMEMEMEALQEGVRVRVSGRRAQGRKEALLCSALLCVCMYVCLLSSAKTLEMKESVGRRV